MNIRNVLLNTAALFVFPCLMCAESAKWAIKPRYSYIADFGEDFFKVKLGGKTGILDKQGNVIVPVSADSITNPSEGYSLVLNLENEKLRLSAVLGPDGSLKQMKDEFYIGDFPFFSENKLPVLNKKGKYGYIDPTGRLVIKCNYGSAHPFSEGYAVVSKKKGIFDNATKAIADLLGTKKKEKVFYINNLGIPLNLQSDIGTVYFASSFRNGKALVMNKDDKRCMIDTSGRLIGYYTSRDEPRFDEKFALTDGYDASHGKDASPSMGNGPTPYVEKGVYGYSYRGDVVLPAQFVYAEPFHEGYAIAKTTAGVGVLKLITGKFHCVRNDGTEKADDPSMVSVNYVVDVPDELKSGVFDMVCKGSNGIEYKVQGTNKDGYFHFPFILPEGRNICELSEKSQEGLVLWRTPKLIGNELKVDVSAGATTANKTARITVYLTNSGNETLSCKMKIAGEGITAKESVVVLSPGVTKTVTTTATGITVASTRNVTITIGDESTTRTVDVKAYKKKKSTKKSVRKKKKQLKGEFA